MSWTAGHPAQQLIAIGVHENVTHGRSDRGSQAVAIDPSQSRAGGNHDCLCGEPGGDGVAQAIEPGPTVRIGQGYPRTHAGNRLRGMKIVAFQKGTLERAGQRGCQSGLAAAGHTHHDKGLRAGGA